MKELEKAFYVRDAWNGGLKSFNKFRDERRSDEYKSKFELRDWIVGGQFYLDRFGQTSKLSKSVAKHMFDIHKAAISADNYWDNYTGELSWSMTWIPQHTNICGYCLRQFTLDDIYNTSCVHDSFETVGKPGMTLGEFAKHYESDESNITHLHLYQTDSSTLYNKKYIDLTLRYPDAEKGSYKHGWVVNKNGWIGGYEGVTRDTVLQEGDIVYFDTHTFFHNECLHARNTSDFKQKVEAVFEKLNIKPVTKIITNEYCDKECCPKWLDIKTIDHHFQIGWRRRVINLRLIDSALNLNEVFKNEQVTVDSTYIHAHGYAKLEEYLTTILKG